MSRASTISALLLAAFSVTACSASVDQTPNEISRLLIGMWSCPSSGNPFLFDVYRFSADKTFVSTAPGVSIKNGTVFAADVKFSGKYSLSWRALTLQVDDVAAHSATANGLTLPADMIAKIERETAEKLANPATAVIEKITDKSLILKDPLTANPPFECLRVGEQTSGQETKTSGETR